MKSVWPVFYSFDPEMVLHFHFTFKPFSGHAQKRESERKKRAQPPKLTPIQLTLGHAELISPPILNGSPITEPNANPRSQSTAPIPIVRSVDHDYGCKAPCQSRSREASIAISWSTMPIAISPSRRTRSREAPRQSQPLAEPSRLSLFLLLSIWPDLMIFFSRFCLCFCIEEWIILYIRLATEKMWPDFMIFFLGFVCVSVLRNEWYYIFVWQSRKCDQQVENVFSMVFSRTQPNTRKYFSKHFLKYNQTHENIFLFGK